MKRNLRKRCCRIQRTIIGIGVRFGRKGAPLEESTPACTLCKTEHKNRNLKTKTEGREARMFLS